MSTTVKSVKVFYEPAGGNGCFTAGDWVCGRVAVEAAKNCQVDSLYIKFKGKAEVFWTERHGKTTVVYHSKDKYFSFKHHFISHRDASGNDNQTLLRSQHGDTYSNVIAQGTHVYPFTFQFPFTEMPPSFTSNVGKIVYLLEAKLSRSMRIPSKDMTKINFVSKVNVTSDPGIMMPQHESKDKKMNIFSSGAVSMDVNIEKTGFFQGEGMKVVASIQNNSSREIKPKYCIYLKESFFARGKRRLHTRDILKEVGEPIPPSTNELVTRVITIPHGAEPSILNCKIIKVEYRLRVYLDVKYASDPEIKFPIIILPGFQVPAVAAPPPAAAAAAAAATAVDFGFASFGSTNPPAWDIAPPQLPPASQSFDPPPPYGSYGLYPPVTDLNKYQ